MKDKHPKPEATPFFILQLIRILPKTTKETCLNVKNIYHIVEHISFASRVGEPVDNTM